MNDLPRQKLCELLIKYGPTLCDDAKKLEGLLKDVLRNEHKRETFVLISTLREGVAHELRGSTSGMPLAALAAKLTRQLCDNLGLNDGVARWSVESWAVALGVEITHPAQPQQDDIRIWPKVLSDNSELPKELKNSIGMKFVLIQPGAFMMALNAEDADSSSYRVEITYPFYLGKYPVTQAEYEAVMGTNPSHFTGNSRRPVENVSWNDAVTFAENLSRRSSETSHGRKYRLPDEAEWEFACRSGTTTAYSFGDDEKGLGKYAWFADNSGKRMIDSTGLLVKHPKTYAQELFNNDCSTHAVGGKLPNGWGLYDMHGNVWEWCSDEDQGDSCGISRGGSWYGRAAFCRSAHRGSSDPAICSKLIGFRLALSPPSEP